MKKIISMLVVVLLCMTCLMSAATAEFTGSKLIPVVDGVGQIMAGSATTAGWSYLYMSAAATVINKYNPEMNITAQITTGGGENLMRIAARDMSMGVAQATYITDWYYGNEEQKVAANPHLRTLYAGPFSIFTPIVRKNSPYQSLADLKGQKISVDSKGGSSQYMNQIIFNALGMGGDFFKQQYLTCAESVVSNLGIAHILVRGQTHGGTVCLQVSMGAGCQKIVQCRGFCYYNSVAAAAVALANTVHND